MDFDADAFLAGPLTAHLATAGPTVRPVWFLWEQQSFWILAGPWSSVPAHLRAEPRVAIVVDVCDAGTGLVQQVTARGRAELLPFGAERGRRMLYRYLGPHEDAWDTRFRRYLNGGPQSAGTAWLRLVPEHMTAMDLSFAGPRSGQHLPGDEPPPGQHPRRREAPAPRCQDEPVPTHVALVRGINVGGRKLAMADFRRVLGDLGHTDVATYIQSGNAVLTSTEPDPALVADGIAAALDRELGLRVPVVVLGRDEYARAIADNPFPAVEATPKLLHAVFRAAPMGPEEIDAVARTVEVARERSGVPEEATVVGRVVYLHLPEGLGRSELATRLMRPPFTRAPDGGGTARNWATVLRLRDMLDA